MSARIEEEEVKNQTSVCGLDYTTIGKAINLRQFYKSGDPYVCKVCNTQLSSSDHFIDQDSTFVKFELLFNISFKNDADDEAPAYYKV